MLANNKRFCCKRNIFCTLYFNYQIFYTKNDEISTITIPIIDIDNPQTTNLSKLSFFARVTCSSQRQTKPMTSAINKLLFPIKMNNFSLYLKYLLNLHLILLIPITHIIVLLCSAFFQSFETSLLRHSPHLKGKQAVPGEQVPRSTLISPYPSHYNTKNTTPANFIAKTVLLQCTSRGSNPAHPD